jgi:rubrerythrin
MSNDVTKCIEILGDAIAFEEEGIRFFSEKAETTGSAMEQKIFRSLAKDEQGHRAYLIGLRDELIKTHNLSPLAASGHDHERTSRQIFESALEGVKDPYEYVPEDLEILKGAMEVERKGYHMYAKAAASVDSPDAKKLFSHLAVEEQGHYDLLKNTYEYIRDPEAWHEYEEGGMLDGG